MECTPDHSRSDVHTPGSSSASISVFVGSDHATILSFASAYVILQASLIAMVVRLGEEVRPENVAIYACNPGLMRADLVLYLLECPEVRRWLPSFMEAISEGKELDLRSSLR